MPDASQPCCICWLRFAANCCFFVLLGGAPDLRKTDQNGDGTDGTDGGDGTDGTDGGDGGDGGDF